MDQKRKQCEEWLKQAEYDIDTSSAMFKSRRYIYCVFMAHLALEKALKASYIKTADEMPPKIHSLIYLAKRSCANIPTWIKVFLEELDDVSVPVRYPEVLKNLLKEYNNTRTKKILKEAQNILAWLRKKIEK